MGDVTRTKADVRPLAGAIVRRGEAGDTLEAGEVLYLDGTNGWKPTDGNDVATCPARGVLVAPQDAVDGDQIDVCVFGPVEGYSGMTPGALLYVSDTAGEVGDAAGSNTKRIGWAMTAQAIFVDMAMPADPA